MENIDVTKTVSCKVLMHGLCVDALHEGDGPFEIGDIITLRQMTADNLIAAATESRTPAPVEIVEGGAL